MTVRYVVGCLDVSVYPANVEMVKSAFNTLGSVCAMAGSHCGWVMMPIFQTQTTQQAWMKHRRTIDEALVKMNLNVTNEVAILFAKPEGSRDGRPMQQPAKVAIHSNYVSSSPWLDSKAVQDGRIESCQLIKITDFIGYDPEAQRPGAASRVEQSHGCCLARFWEQAILHPYHPGIEQNHVADLGIPAHRAMMDGLMDITLRDTDRLVWFDILSNRHWA